jgi:Family of unknown function (DUF5694)
MTCFLSLVSALALAVPALAGEKPVEVMVLGSYHFGNPGQDVNNVQVDSVLTPSKQAELDAVARALLTFRPTHVMVEMQSEAPEFAAKSYQSFTDERLKSEANEIVQIGFRVAKMAGLAVVNAIDEQPKDGEPDYFPYDKVQETAAKFGQTSLLAKSNAQIQTWGKEFAKRQKTETVARLLIDMNIADQRFPEMAFYYDILPLGDGDTQTGAELNAAWYLRNAKIFGKLMQVAKPGNRVLVIYGAGHNFWLKHFATETPGYRNVDVVQYLKKAKARR